nr:MAG TPA: protein of unknown function (DUF5534) [Caudoviricetes sp.]
MGIHADNRHKQCITSLNARLAKQLSVCNIAFTASIYAGLTIFHPIYAFVQFYHKITKNIKIPSLADTFGTYTHTCTLLLYYVSLL